MNRASRHPAPSGLAEILDRLVTLELLLHGDPPRETPQRRRAAGAGEGNLSFLAGLQRLYRAARRQVGRPLADAAAAALLRRMQPGDCLILTTGLVAPGIPRGETDGPAGALVLARAAILGRGVRVLMLTEAEAVPVLAQTAEALAASEGDARSWRVHLEIRDFPTEVRAATGLARQLWAERQPVALVSVEKLGPNGRGVIHNLVGQDVTATQARSDRLFPLARRTGTLTIGIGDRGNEIGLGGLLRPAGRCACPCGGGIACVLRAEIPVLAFSSNWGAHAVAAALAVRLGLPRLLHQPRSERRMLTRMVRAGAVDGITRRAAPTVDGGGLALQTAVVASLRALVDRARLS